MASVLLGQSNTSLLLFIVSIVNVLEFMTDSASAINFKEAPRLFSRVASMEHLDQVYTFPYDTCLTGSWRASLPSYPVSPQTMEEGVIFFLIYPKEFLLKFS